MNHILQFAIDIDDARIVEMIERDAQKQVIGEIKQAVVNRLFDPGYYRKTATISDKLSDFSKQIVTDFLEANKDEVIDRASKYLAEKLSTRKAAKALVGGEQ